MGSISFPWATNECYELLGLLPGPHQAPLDMSKIPERLSNEMELCVHHDCAETSNPVVDEANCRAQHLQPPYRIDPLYPPYQNWEVKPTSIRRTPKGDACLAERVKAQWYRFFTMPWPIVAAIIGAIITAIVGITLFYLRGR